MKASNLHALPILENIKIASPCQVPWEEMQGDDRTRFCSHCSLHVHNLSAMTRTEAQAFMAQKQGRVCVRFFKRFDGTVLTQDCPVGLAAVRERIAKTICASVAIIFGVMSSIALTTYALAARSNRSSQTNGSGFHWFGGRSEKPYQETTGEIILSKPEMKAENSPMMGDQRVRSKATGRAFMGVMGETN